MNGDEPVMAGLLILPSLKKTKKHPQAKYCLLFKSSKYGVERIEAYDSRQCVNEAEAKIIPLTNCIKITDKTVTLFRITLKTEVYDFDALEELEKEKWISAIQSIVFPDDASKMTTIEEDNDLYCSSGEGIYNVRILSTAASQKCGIDNKCYTLSLTPIELEIRNANGTTLYTWPYCFIRKYGIKKGVFTFEAGRKCNSGEGVFLIEHPNKEEIFRLVSLKMKSMKKLLSAGTNISDGSDLHVAMSMEARSRTPLPPSVSTLSLNENISHHTTQRNVPYKPPRKKIGPKPVDLSPDYEPIEGYDKVENLNQAWRTRGVDEVSHNEVTYEDGENEDIYTSSWGGDPRNRKYFNSKANNNAGPKIINQKLPEDESYDTLSFFGSSTKLNANSSYKQVVPPPVAPVVEPPSFNVYDEVETCLQGVRLADDSHLGYATIRKEPLKQQNNVHHQFHNDEPYAIISKPKEI